MIQSLPQSDDVVDLFTCMHDSQSHISYASCCSYICGGGTLVSMASNSMVSATVGTAPELMAPAPPEGCPRRAARREIDL